MEQLTKRKVCPLLVQSDTNPSCTVTGQSWTRTYFLECLGNKCVAYRAGYGCLRFDDNPADLNEEEEHGTLDKL